MSELKTMRKNQMILGSHSKNHFVFSKLNENEQVAQITQSFEYLQRLLGSFYAKIFCYSYGGFHTFTDFSEQTLAKNGVKFSFNAESKDITKQAIRTRPQALPRYDCNEFEFGKANLG